MRGDLLVQQRDSPQRDQSASTFEKLIISSEIRNERRWTRLKPCAAKTAWEQGSQLFITKSCFFQANPAWRYWIAELKTSQTDLSSDTSPKARQSLPTSLRSCPARPIDLMSKDNHQGSDDPGTWGLKRVVRRWGAGEGGQEDGCQRGPGGGGGQQEGGEDRGAGRRGPPWSIVFWKAHLKVELPDRGTTFEAWERMQEQARVSPTGQRRGRWSAEIRRRGWPGRRWGERQARRRGQSSWGWGSEGS